MVSYSTRKARDLSATGFPVWLERINQVTDAKVIVFAGELQ
jgi:hypothetical protein